MTVNVRKASGETEPFDPYKLEGSLRNAGAEDALVASIIEDIGEWIYEGVTTKKIYSRAFQLLNRIRKAAASRYKLKQAIFEMGPTGYPFEHLVGKLFERNGYTVQVGITLAGRCVTHEMDVVATGNNEQQLIECKYGRDQGKVISVQTPLYVKARVDDIIEKYREEGEFEGYRFQGWVVTNTRFSADSERYAGCSGLKLMAWDYPKGEGLKDAIEKAGIYPITVLASLTRKEQQSLLDKGIVICSQLLDNLDALDEIHFPRKKSTSLVKELNDILYLGK